MKKTASVLITLTGIWFGSLQAAESPRPESFDRHVNRVRDSLNLPGVAVVVTRGGEIVYDAYLGVEADSRFHVASLTKSMTARAVMQLVAAGRLELDADFRSYLPGFEAAPGEPISLRQLLHHTSGIATVAGNHWSDPGTTLQDEAARYRGLTPPSTRFFAYSNSNYNLLGAVIEQVSGMEFEDYLVRQVLAPAGVGGIDFQPGAGLVPGHLRFFGFMLPVRPPVFHNYLPAAGALASAEQMARYGNSLLEPARIPGNPLFTDRVPVSPGLEYAMGLYVREFAGLPAYFHNGEYSGYSSLLWLLPDEELVVAVLSNSLLLTGATAFAALPENLARIALGMAPEPVSTDYGYLLLILSFGAIVSLQLYRLGRAWKTRRDGAGWRPVAWLGADLAALFLWLYLLPAGLGINLASMHRFLPDFALLLALLIGAGLLLCLLHGRRLLSRANPMNSVGIGLDADSGRIG